MSSLDAWTRPRFALGDSVLLHAEKVDGGPYRARVAAKAPSYRMGVSRSPGARDDAGWFVRGGI